MGNNHTKYEKNAIAEIIAWKNEKEGLISKIAGKFTNPLGKIINVTVRKVVPQKIIDGVTKGIINFLEKLKDASNWTFSHKSILNTARKNGIEIKHSSALQNYDLELLDKIATSFFTENKLMATIQGGGCGLGGITLIAADVPALFMINFRLIQQIGCSYGFDTQNQEFFPIIMSIFSIASADSDQDRFETISDLEKIFDCIIQEQSINEFTEQAKIKGVLNIIKDKTKKLPGEISRKITHRKLAQSVPVLGIVVGAGFNYWFTGNVAKTAYMVFRYLYLKQKYGKSLIL